MRKQMEKYYGKPSEMGKNIKKAAKKVVSDAKNSPQAKAAVKAVKSPRVQTAAGLLIPGGVAMKVPKIAKGLKTAGKAVAKAVGARKSGSLAKKAENVPFKPDYKPPKTDILESRYGREYLTPTADRRIRQQDANDFYKSMQKKRQDELDAKIQNIRRDPTLSVNQKENAVDKLMRASKK